MVATLTACGSDSSDSSGDSSSSASSGSLDGVKVEGDVGKEPEVTWDGKMDVGDIETTVLTKGDGEEIAEGDQVQANLWIGNGFTQKKAFSTYDNGQPETVTASADLNPVFKDAIVGQTIGSRVAVTASAQDAFGDAGNPQLEIGNKDSVLIIVDLIEMYTPPKPTDVPQSKMPGIVEKNGEPVSLDFKGLPAPKADGDLLRSIVKEGDGKTVTSDMTLTVNYLGQVYDGKKPFDESYSKEPASFALTGVVKGWTYGLTGVKEGSRVLLQIPPELGYGAQEQAGIPANSTLYFVIDVISAK
jgi:FKBP-type peptidyl-prolyl cis-trans isomerase